MAMEVDSTFRFKKIIEIPGEDSPEYIEYRRKWNDNPKNHIVGDFPIHLDLEATSACNLKCVMCFQSFNPPKSGFMDFDLYKKLIDESSAKGLCSLKLNIRGEPLLHPKIVDMVRYAKQKGILEVMFNTNANLLTEEMSKKLIEAGLDKLVCSIDGYTPEIYEKVRVGGNFNTVLNNIKTLQSLKKKLGLTKPVVRVQMVDIPQNHNLVDEYIKFWGAVADHVGIEDMNDWHDKNLDSVIVSKEFDCPFLYQRLMVWYDGSVNICCGNVYGKLIAGDLNKQTIEEVWKGPVMKKLRELIASGESHKIQICAECGFRVTVIRKFNLKYDVKSLKNERNPYYEFSR